jgi:hypothetical protein
MIQTFLITVLVEGVVVLVYSISRRKPVIPILLTSLMGNLLTQSLLWIALTFSFRHYLVALVITEIIIWGIESLLFHVIRANQLNLKEAALLSLAMNGTSLALGWSLPV